MMTGKPGRGHRAARVVGLAAATGVLLAGCGSSGSSSPAAGSPAPAAPPRGAAGSVTYQLHMDFFSRESKLSPVIDPQVFVASPGTLAGSGPQMIRHVAGIRPAAKASAPSTGLLGADGAPLKITLGEWEKAAGRVTVSCRDGAERAASRLTGLVPSGSYSTFVVHLDVQGPGRFTPWGDPQGTTNNFTAGADGSAAPSDTVPGCLDRHAAAVIIWHSDGRPHGPMPGVLGVTWHNSLITPLP